MKTKKTKPVLSWEEVHGEATSLSKWMALYDAVNLIYDKAKEKGIKNEKIVYKPKAIKNFIKSTEDIYLKKILRDSYNIDICYDESCEENQVEYKF